ncbi:MAG: 2-amino-4-hydroxy-6-hydroxymethyldihydropteridine diphosphokinase [Sedimentisphaerales bacterium]|nr:2-amino-4-hydroxy-6-hydroxymethyldihydropteridine diphosphokinase [Sedimentisphaerales bacterium]
MKNIYIALGANEGDRAANIIQALMLLEEDSDINVCLVSQMIETEPVGGPKDQNAYLNAVARLQSSLDAGVLLERLQAIEARLGRVRTEKWGPRPIDLDILLVEDEIIDTPDLQVPHPLMHQRFFVLAPLLEIAPDVRHPVLKKSVAELFNLLVGK